MKTRTRILYAFECREGGFWWSHKRKEWFVPKAPEDWSGIGSGVQFTTKQKMLKHANGKLPKEGIFAMTMFSCRNRKEKGGWRVLQEWERAPE